MVPHKTGCMFVCPLHQLESRGGQIDMTKGIRIAAGVILILHGLVHLLGLVAYWPLADIAELPYKTALLGGAWDLGEGGMRVISVLWLIAGLGFVAGGGGQIAGQGWTAQVLVFAALLSVALTALDWKVAFMGAILDVLILLAIVIAPHLPAFQPDDY